MWVSACHHHQGVGWIPHHGFGEEDARGKCHSYRIVSRTRALNVTSRLMFGGITWPGRLPGLSPPFQAVLSGRDYDVPPAPERRRVSSYLLEGGVPAQIIWNSAQEVYLFSPIYLLIYLFICLFIHSFIIISVFCFLRFPYFLPRQGAPGSCIFSVPAQESVISPRSLVLFIGEYYKPKFEHFPKCLSFLALSALKKNKYLRVPIVWLCHNLVHLLPVEEYLVYFEFSAMRMNEAAMSIMY